MTCDPIVESDETIVFAPEIEEIYFGPMPHKSPLTLMLLGSLAISDGAIKCGKEQSDVEV